VKSELRNRSSEYSDISDSEDSGPDCTALVCSEPYDLCVSFDGKMRTYESSPGGRQMTASPKACLASVMRSSYSGYVYTSSCGCLP
jgi:hypothetical protein